MLKRLLYLYNDGHNPFPKLGKGGLGYHLPQYRKRMHGESVVNLGDGNYSYFNDDLDYEYDSSGFIEGPIPSNIRSDFDNWVQTQNGTPSAPILYKRDDYDEDTPEGYENIMNKEQIEKNLEKVERKYQTNDELRAKLKREGVKGPLKSMNTEQLRELYNEKIAQIKPKPITMHESMKKVDKVDYNFEKDKERIEKSITDLFMNNYEFGMVGKVRKELKERMKDLSKNSLEYKIYSKIKEEIENSYLDSDLKLLKKQINKKSDDELSLLELTLKDIFKMHDDKMEETKVLIDSISNLSLDERFEVVSDNYDDILKYYKTENPTSGKGFEDFLYKGVGKTIIEYNTNDNSEVINNDENKNIHPDLRDYSTVDLFNDTTVIECKDYWFINSTEDIVLQYTKIISDSNGKLLYNGDGKIDSYMMFDYQDDEGNPHYKNVMPGKPREYKVYFNLEDGLYEYNISKIIKKYAISKKINSTTKFEFDENDIINGIFGQAKKDGKRVKDYANNLGFIIKKDSKYFKKIN